MTSRFLANPASPEDIRTVAAAMPENPFMTAAYVATQQELAFTPWRLVGRDAAGGAATAIGFMRQGRLARGLEFATLPPLSADAPFWSDLIAFCQAHAVTDLALQTAAAPAVQIPTLHPEERRIERTEFVLERSEGDLWAGVRKGHRYEIKRARKLGLELRRGFEAALVESHLDLHRSSMRRRAQRGEDVDLDLDEREVRALVHAQAAELFQVVGGEATLSSLLLLRSSTAGYAHSSGSSPSGMQQGASQLLWFEVARLLADDGASFNLGGCRSEETGLRSFKEGFGARALPMESVSVELSGRLRRLVRRGAAMMRDLRRPRRAAAPDFSAADVD
jgi:hypothetical protein